VAAASEEAKDNQYLDSASKNGGEFVPLICESFGVWIPYALSTLFSTADRSTVNNGLPCKLAKKQLLQQLSITLWHYNARMILRRQFALSLEDKFNFENVIEL